MYKDIWIWGRHTVFQDFSWKEKKKKNKWKRMLSITGLDGGQVGGKVNETGCILLFCFSF